MKSIGEAIAFTATICCATYLTDNGHEIKLLWVVIVVWALCSKWGK